MGQAGTVSLNAAPLDIADRFREIFFESRKPVVLTSATLGVGEQDLGYLSKRLGAEAVRAEQIGSPFDYARQMRLYVVSSMPDPTEDDFEWALEQWIAHFVTQSSGRIQPSSMAAASCLPKSLAKTLALVRAAPLD